MLLHSEVTGKSIKIDAIYASGASLNDSSLLL